MLVLSLSTNLSNNVSQQISESWDGLWDLVLEGGLYRVLANAGIVIAIGCLMIFLVDFAKKWLQDERGNWTLSEMAFPLIVVFFLANGDTNLATATRSLRDIINNYNDQVLGAVSNQVNFENSLQQIAQFSSASGQITELRAQCNAIVEQEALPTCLRLQNQKAQEVLTEYRRNNPGAETSAWANELAKRMSVNELDPSSPIQGVQQILQGGVGLYLSNSILPVIEALVVAFQAAFQQLLEASMLVTALLGPIALGSSLLPFGAKPFYAWLTGFFSLGMCKLCLNLLTGLMAVATSKVAPYDMMPTAIAIGILSPILALALAGGGGLAVFNGITSAVGGAAGTVGGGAGSIAVRAIASRMATRKA